MSKKVLITGATSGIGRSLTYRLAEDGYDLYVVGRSNEKLAELKTDIEQRFKQRCVCYCVDLNKSEEVKSFLVNELQVDILIHCAGIGKVGDFNILSIEEEEEILQVNVQASMLLLKTFAQRFVAQDYGVIAVICSTAAFYPHPFMNTYASSKAFLYHYSLGLGEEVRKYSKQVKVIAVSPGPTSTAFFEPKTKEKMVRSQTETHFEMSAEQVGKGIANALFSNRSAVTIGRRNQLMTVVLRCLPLKLRIKVVGKYIAKGV
ncbi:SDR family NAD(P)-dependent oxidoreductase [Enterococcus sp. BWR-S5]|uniref:SDR family NAD(P)-dependent oxidoreductase n=1 Tax=Enterococcus sp. BWR-S5 TaxID=2787714 RepID=UPI0019208E51|nr:SDR family NAD(P)-dependent oxidoreductase [Enterococcus sp. BWR-S5]MBL1226372.1 SDR family NAD(P)-dependent oxidoreductase [Enterococcus sp. BWR-S5]